MTACTCPPATRATRRYSRRTLVSSLRRREVQHPQLFVRELWATVEPAFAKPQFNDDSLLSTGLGLWPSRRSSRHVSERSRPGRHRQYVVVDGGDLGVEEFWWVGVDGKVGVGDVPDGGLDTC